MTTTTDKLTAALNTCVEIFRNPKWGNYTYMDGEGVYRDADMALKEIDEALAQHAAEKNSVAGDVFLQVRAEFVKRLKDIPLGAENIGHGRSEYNWGIHYLGVFDEIVRAAQQGGEK